MNKGNNESTLVEGLTEVEIQAIETFYGAWKAKKPEWLDEICSPDWQDIPLPPQQKEGPQGLKDIISFFIANFPDVEIVVGEIVGTHERAGVRAKIIFTHDKELMGIAPTHTKVEVAIHEFHHLKDGKITHTWHLEDWFSLVNAAQALKKLNIKDR